MALELQEVTFGDRGANGIVCTLLRSIWQPVAQSLPGSVFASKSVDTCNMQCNANHIGKKSTHS
jgi:hypothetical protein